MHVASADAQSVYVAPAGIFESSHNGHGPSEDHLEGLDGWSNCRRGASATPASIAGFVTV